jgi:hypothetical protein
LFSISEQHQTRRRFRKKALQQNMEHLLEALLVLLRSNVDPGAGKEHFSSYDDFCAWAFENLLHVQGVVSAASMQQFLSQACAEGDPDISRSALVLPKVGPADFLSLPLETARLREAEGGLALPQLCLTSSAACVAQLQVTLCQSMQTIASIADCQATGPAGLATSP